MSRVYYNEIEPYPAQWLRNLMAAGLIPAGDVDERSIIDVRSDDLAGYDQCHFFSGLGGWPYALSGAGWGDRPVWTGSCPCQPFSVAGNGEGFDDPRHLWPHFKRLIAERRPPVVFGEQVAAAAKWLNLVRGDLETLDYAVGCIPMEAASADADHFRDRYWFVADHDIERASTAWKQRSGQLGRTGSDPQDYDRALPNNNSIGSQVALGQSGDVSAQQPAITGSDLCSVVDNPSIGWGEGWTESEFRSRGFTAAVASIDDRQYVECPDGKWRRLPPPGVRWLGNGISARIPKLRAIGNAIDPRPARQFITAYMAARGLTSIREAA